MALQAVAVISDCYHLGLWLQGLNNMQMSSCVGSVAAIGSLLEGSPCRGDFFVCGGP